MSARGDGRRKPPDGSIRRSQMLTAAGPGAIVDLVDYAVVIKGLDTWQYADRDEGFLEEPRLEKQALSMLKGAGHWEHNHVRLRLPPRCEDDDPAPWRGVHAREFPSWYLCRTCRSLVRRDGLDEKREHACYADTRRNQPTVPIRFVSACPKGHLQDINWRGFVHAGQVEEGMEKAEGQTQVYYCHPDPEHGSMVGDDGQEHTADLALITTGTSGGLTDLVVVCRRCGRTRGLQDLRLPHALGTCAGWRPWLQSNDDHCDEQAKLLIRTGSNVWFPQRLSVLSIPDVGEDLRRKVSKFWGSLKRVETLRDLQMAMSLIEEVEEAFADEDETEVLDAIRAKRDGADKKAVPIREAEWAALMAAPPGYADDLPPKGERWFARQLDQKLPDYLDRVVLVHALREVRAMVGFTRIEGVNVGPEGDLELAGQQTAPLSEHKDWIPAVEILGEGVFLAFDEAALRAWEDRDAVKVRESQFRAGLRRENELAPSDTSMDRFTSARMLMLHSLAHMLITQISLECGYSASAIRERIYCYRHPEDPTKSRAGILLYTGTPGSEGTLGGLVEVGREIVRHIDEAVERNLICSNDPVCAQHEPDGPEDGRGREGAACHGCLLIAEPSCERMNRDLDRALVVPTLEDAGAAFLGGE
ncbi:MAG: DUF1998 domain-containing protein [Alphaproteobacteria bacterium]|nr:DUF1998 domain-containing protein [Alphaproteobacteria bacterium]